jgi:soluble lytic murein transglycosylase-like protein
MSSSQNKTLFALVCFWVTVLAAVGLLSGEMTFSFGEPTSGASEQESLFPPTIEPIASPGPLTSPEGNDRFDGIIRQASRKFGVDFFLIKGIIKAESMFNPWAVSDMGACGLMQLMPSTARLLGVKDIFDPHDNIFGGVKYLKQLLTRFDGNNRLALAAYNAGIARVLQYGGVPPFPVTRTYLAKVLDYVEEFKTS